jgi:hypothetical protein
MRSDTQTLIVDTPKEVLFDFLATPENLPKWAVKFCHAIRPRDKTSWWVQGCMGEIPIRFSTDPVSGVIDYHMPAPTGEGVIPSRVVPVGNRSAYVFTQFQPPGMADDAFQEQVEALKEELQVLKRLMESKDGNGK